MNESKLQMIRGLLAKAEASNFEAEAETLRAKADELIAKYGISEHLLAAEDRSAKEVISIYIKTDGAYSSQQRHLVHAIARAVGCYAISTWTQEAKINRALGKRQGYDAVQVYGYDTLVELVEILFTSLLLQLGNARAKLTLAEARAAGHPSTRSYRTSWSTGWAETVGARLAQAYFKEEAAEGGTSTALVLADSKKVFRAAAEQDTEGHGKIVSTRVRVASGGGFAAGKKAGHQADIHQTRVGGSRAALTR